ncbi:MAG: hypothetical protein HZT40_02840 [Candidatus Thiothrix singaporensis]|uniref:Uncharacterized protein n=1 Tax=Candidatus Thiothrix singaporensis TaxID=2799669 RepID=A0A7L6ANR2_9GAMM|nr:MAG: hypothetical protein HZT40_02840 [Candidatus Thiothrix singaporensis]
MQAIEFNATPHGGMLLIPEIYRQQWEGLAVRVILLPADEVAPTTPKPKTLLERLRTVEKINAAPDLSDNHDAYVLGQTDA